MENTNGQLPHWDLDIAYPGIDSSEFTTAFDAALAEIKSLTDYFDAHGIERQDTAVTDGETIEHFEHVIARYNDLLDRVIRLNSYVVARIAVNSRDNAAHARQSELQPYIARVQVLGTRLTAWLGSLDVDRLEEGSAVARDHSYMLRRAQIQARHLMSPAEEDLAAEMSLTGKSAWYQMFNTHVSQLTADVEIDGDMQTLPLTAAQNLAFSPDRDLRQRAHEAVIVALEAVTVPMSAALNAIKGESLTLSRRRGWASPLDAVLFNNAIDRETLDALMTATRAAFPDFRRYMKARARALGLPVLAWFDRVVPLGQGQQQWDYAAASQFVIDQFATYSPRMQAMAERAFAENWIDAEPRDGKRGGAFCLWLRDDESRIMANFEPSFASVGTLAHELGHAYHNVNLAHRTQLQRTLPMTLAETASTFCQKIVENAALKEADEMDQMIVLDGLLEYASRVILGASAHFMFEEEVFKRREQRKLSIEELTELTLQMQRQTYGDALDPEWLQPYRWVYVPHFFVTNFYNFPYTFGLLFGLGLYAEYTSDPEGFKAGYDDLLSMTGMADAHELAARFGIDIRSTAFWEASLDVLRGDIDRFESLVDRLRQPA